MIKVLFLIGTRPEAIKLASVIEIFRTSGIYDVRVCSTSQHKEMLDQVVEFFGIAIDYNLNVMVPDQGLPDLTARIFQSLSSSVLASFKPDWLVVQGDTTTAMVGALTGFYHKIKIAHVEAGLRSNDLYSPFPEEMNRLVISKVAHCHFCPTEKSVHNLAAEGIVARVFETGNTVIDALLLGRKLVKHQDQSAYRKFFEKIDLQKKIILVTCHRRENFGDPFQRICQALQQIAATDENYLIIYPVHLNPNIRERAAIYLQHPRIVLLEPLSYPNLLWLMDKSYIVITDSGGIQEEAPSLGKPVIVLRDVTERMESIDAGVAVLAGTSTERIVKESLRLLRDEDHYRRMSGAGNPYGDGTASQQIFDILGKLS